MSTESALERAFKAAGNKLTLSKRLGISHQAVAQWTRAPAERVLQLEKLTGVSRHDLRPDLYPRENQSVPGGAENAAA
jgi:DNA-binding transcriptional regulator YdaS (Cro superfamily)